MVLVSVEVVWEIVVVGEVEVSFEETVVDAEPVTATAKEVLAVMNWRRPALMTWKRPT